MRHLVLCTLFFLVSTSLTGLHAQASSKKEKKPELILTPEQVKQHEITKMNDVLNFFKVTDEKEKSQLEIIKNKMKLEQATLSKQGRALTKDEELKIKVLQSDVFMIDRGLNPLKMTKDEKITVLKFLTEKNDSSKDVNKSEKNNSKKKVKK